MGKPWYLSRTILIAGLQTAAGILGVLAGSELITQHPQAAAVVVTVAGIVQFLLRFVTTQPVVR